MYWMSMFSSGAAPAMRHISPSLHLAKASDKTPNSVSYHGFRCHLSPPSSFWKDKSFNISQQSKEKQCVKTFVTLQTAWILFSFIFIRKMPYGWLAAVAVSIWVWKTGRNKKEAKRENKFPRTWHPRANGAKCSLTFQSTFTFSAVLDWNHFVEVFHVLVHIITGFVVTVLLGKTGRRQQQQYASRKWIKYSV